MTFNSKSTLSILEAALLMRARLLLDSKRNDLFKFIDKYSKQLDLLAEKRIAQFNTSQYAMFRDITDMARVSPMGRPYASPKPSVEVEPEYDFLFTDEEDY